MGQFMLKWGLKLAGFGLTVAGYIIDKKLEKRAIEESVQRCLEEKKEEEEQEKEEAAV